MPSAENIELEEEVMPNPFTPTFGKVPAIMAGRGPLIDELLASYDNGPGDPNLTTIVVGARGTGKTALLASVGTLAEGSGWIAVRSTAITGMLQDVYEQTQRKAAHLLAPAPTHRVTGVSVGGVAGVQFEAGALPEQNWRSKMTDLLEALAEHDVGLLIEVDEVDPSLQEMTQLVTTYQHFVTEDRKVALLMAGLPHKVSGLLNGESVSFLRRACRQQLAAIEGYEVAEALRQTCEAAGKSISDDALVLAVEAIGGFPYMLQLVGYRFWSVAGEREEVDAAAVERGVAFAENDMRTRVLKPTLDELSAGDLRFLESMLQDAGESQLADIAARLGRSRSYVASYKKRLLERGVVEEAGRSRLRFALPLLREEVPVYIAEEL